MFTFLGLGKAHAYTHSYQGKVLAVIHYDEGKFYADQGKHNKALASFQTSLIYQPDKYLSEAMAAISCRSLDLYASADYYFSKAIESSGYAQAYSNLGALYAELGYDEDAFECLYKAIDRKSEYAYPYNNIGGILLRHGKYDEAVTNLRIAIEYAPKMPDPYYNIGTAHYENNNPDSAIYYYSKAIEVNPRFFKAYLAKANVLKSINKPKEEYADLCMRVVEAYSKIIKQNPDGYEAYLMRANAYKLLGQKSDMKKDMERKLEKLDKFISLYPNAYTFIRDRANLHFEMGNTPAAITDYKRVLEINPMYEWIRKKLNKISPENADINITTIKK